MKNTSQVNKQLLDNDTNNKKRLNIASPVQIIEQPSKEMDDSSLTIVDLPISERSNAHANQGHQE